MLFSRYYLVTYLGLIISPFVFAMPPIEAQTMGIKKIYWNGDSISIQCKKNSSQLCVLSVIAKNRKRKIELNFSKYTLVPNLQDIGLIILSESGNEFIFYTGVACSDPDIEMIPSSINNADCIARFKIIDGLVTENPRIEIYPIATQNLYRELKGL
jgi:hypothetical protein